MRDFGFFGETVLSLNQLGFSRILGSKFSADLDLLGLHCKNALV